MSQNSVTASQPGRARDPQRLFTAAQRRQIAVRQNHECASCTQPLPKGWHAHHVIPHAACGPTTVDNAVGVCPQCHQTAPTSPLPGIAPRTWQSDALTSVLPRLLNGQFATINAAPGAGKTNFALLAVEQLLARDAIDRVVFVEPTTHLRTQIAAEAARVGLPLDTANVVERHGYVGTSLTYQALANPNSVDAMRAAADSRPTLYIFDEVHHLSRKQHGGDAGAWAVAVHRLVGSHDKPRAAVLNLSGTLFRSSPQERISTVAYRPTSDGAIEAVADYSITAADLIEQGHLRPVRLLSFDADLTVDAVDPAAAATAGANTVRVIDLTGQPRGVRHVAMTGLLTDTDKFIQPMLEETVERLRQAAAAFSGPTPMKGLVIAQNQAHARQVYAEVADLVGSRSAMIATSDDADADANITRFRTSSDQAILVAVQMVTEGFDCPDVAVLAYMRTWTAPLHTNQMIGRVMRVSDAERRAGRTIPATVLIPNDGAIKQAFADVLVGPMAILPPTTPCSICGELHCLCPPLPVAKICAGCSFPWRLCVCQCPICAQSRASGCGCPRRPGGGGRATGTPVTVTVDSAASLTDVHYNGDQLDVTMFADMETLLTGRGVPNIYAGGATAAIQDKFADNPYEAAAFIKRLLNPATHTTTGGTP